MSAQNGFEIFKHLRFTNNFKNYKSTTDHIQQRYPSNLRYYHKYLNKHHAIGQNVQ